MSSSAIDKITAVVSDLPPIPAVAQEVMGLLSDISTTPERLQVTLSRDPALSLKVLKTSNSAYYRRGREISVLSEAIVLLGFKTIQTLVMGMAVQKVFSGAGKYSEILWEHCFVVGAACREIAKKRGFSMSMREEAFLCGLFHDVGKGVIAIKFPGIYTTPISREEEVEMIGFDHADLGKHILQSWKIPAILAESVGNHHTPHAMPLADFVIIANWMSDSLAPGIFPGKRPCPTDLLDQYQLSSVAVDDICESVQSLLHEEKGQS